MNKKTAYLIVRLAIGVSLFGHGLVRLFKLQTFSASMVKDFQNAILPEMIVLPFSYFLPFAEFTLGLFLIIGLFTRITAIAASILMLLLILGTTLIEHWGNLPSMLIHIAFFAYLIQHIEQNSFSVDKN